MKQVDIVFNPKAGRGRAPNLAARVAALLEPRAVVIRQFTIEQYLAPTFVTSDVDTVVTLGGDGTVRAIVDGLSRRSPERMPPIAVLAMGTANLLSRHLRLPWSESAGFTELAEAISHGRMRSIDIAVANGVPFLLMCSAGFDAQVVHEVAARRKGPITMLHYLPAFGRSVLKLNVTPISVVVDGRMVFKEMPGLVVVANAAEYGTGFSLNPTAISDDGRLDVTIFKAGAHEHLISTALHAVSGQIDEGAAVVTRGKTIEILGEGSPAQLDGEAFGQTPLTIGLLPFRANFIVPP